MSTFGHLPWTMSVRFGSAPAVADDAQSLTFDELEHRTAAAAEHLQDLGVGRGDVVALMLANQVELLVAMAAAWRLGAAATPVNPAFTDEEAAHQLGDAAVRLVITDRERVVDVPQLGVDALRTTSSRRVAPVSLTGEEIALVVYSSGSTGRPKGVMLDHHNVEAMTACMQEHFALAPRDHCLLVLPLFHVNAIMVSALAPLRAGGRVTISSGFSASAFFDLLERVRPTYFSAVPAIYAMLAALPDEVEPDTSSLRFVVCGAAPVSEELLTACHERYGFRIVEGYGLTEGTCASACNPVEGPRKLGTVGPALPGQRIRVVDARGDDVPVGERGEVLISGPTVMRGYLGLPEATAETVVDGWLHTGDVGVLDDDGYLRIVDRIKDMLIRGGENIYPKEIEAEIAGLDGVLESAVVGRADPVLGEVPVAYVVAYPGADVRPEQVMEHCARGLTRVKVPAEVHIVDALPKNPVGKIDKPRLRRSLVAS